MQNILVHNIIIVHILCSECAIRHSQLVIISFIEFLIDFYIILYDKMYAKIHCTIKKLLQFKHSKLCQILHVDKTGFSGPVTNYECVVIKVR